MQTTLVIDNERLIYYFWSMEFSREAYLARLEELYRISPSVQSVGFAPDAYKPGLEGMLELDSALGCPSTRLKCIHVAGTNGKGSTCCMLAASLAASGYRVGLYTSPHLFDFRERIKILSGGGGTVSSLTAAGPSFEMIPEEEVFGFLEDNREILRGRSFFEVTTAMAFWWFDVQNIDIAVIEVGLGGLLDSTNIINPEISVITSIGLDHCSILGNTRTEIAAQKAGIFKPGTPALVWGHDDETDPVFEETASRVACPLFFADDSGSDEDPNCGTVRSALVLLGLEVREEAIRDFRQIAGLRGRWDTLQTCPLTICDIGHNPAALKMNFDRLRAFKRPLLIVYGVMADKDYVTNISLFPPFARCFLSAPAIPRALPVDRLEEAFRQYRPELDCRSFGSVREAVKAALDCAASIPDSIVYICGSTFVVSEAAECFEL